MNGKVGQEIYQTFIAEVTGDDPGYGCHTGLQKVQFGHTISSAREGEGERERGEREREDEREGREEGERERGGGGGG